MKTISNLTVRSYHIDYFGHVNHARYVELLEEARWQYLEKNELLGPIHEVGAIHVVAQILIKYRNPSIIGDVLQIETRIVSRKQHGFNMSQKAMAVQSGDLVLEAIVTNIFVDGKGQPRLINDNILGIWPDLSEANYIE